MICRCILVILIALPCTIAVDSPLQFSRASAGELPPISRETRDVEGWKLHIHRELLEKQPELTNRAVELLTTQLQEIVRVVPKSAVVELRKVPLYFSPEYPDKRPAAEFHNNVSWLKSNHRDPAMAKAVEFTNIRIFEDETRRMPNFALHELAHAYHSRVLPEGFGEPRIKARYEDAKSKGIYERVERWFGNGKPNTFEKAYGMNNCMEYFAETSEAYFSRNDFYPFVREELQRHDPEMEKLLSEVWGAN